MKGKKKVFLRAKRKKNVLLMDFLTWVSFSSFLNRFNRFLCIYNLVFGLLFFSFRKFCYWLLFFIFYIQQLYELLWKLFLKFVLESVLGKVFILFSLSSKKMPLLFPDFLRYFHYFTVTQTSHLTISVLDLKQIHISNE